MKIAFVAMSGVRACDQELLELGLTLPGFVERSKVVAALPSLGLLTLAGMTPKEHEISYVEIEDIRNSETVQNALEQCDLIAISSFSAQMSEGYELAETMKAKGVQVVLGGLHVTSVPDEAKAYCDSVIIGEGEPCWLDVLADAEKGELKPFYDMRGVEFDLDDAPMPAFELLEIEKYNRLTVQTSRGCSHKCEFCASSILLTQKYKQKPMEKVLAEIDRIKEIWEHPFIEFADDNSLVNKEYWRQLLPELKKRHVKWFAETDISIAEDEELIQMMRESGCVQVLIGLESLTPESLEGIETASDWKVQQLSHYREAITTIQSHGISVNGCFILGLDQHTTDVFDSVYEFVDSSGLHEVQITIQTPFPGTPLYERLKRDGRIIDDGAWEKCTLFDINYIPKSMSVQELSHGFKGLSKRLYSEEFTKKRRKHFTDMMRQAIHEKRQGEWCKGKGARTNVLH